MLQVMKDILLSSMILDINVLHCNTNNFLINLLHNGGFQIFQEETVEYEMKLLIK